MKEIPNNKTYGYNDVMIVPKYSEVNSRANVDLVVEYPQIHYKGIPVIGANMDSVSTAMAAAELSRLGLGAAIHKFEDNDLINKLPDYDGVFYTTGLRKQDQDKLSEYIKKFGAPKNLCMDVPNGYIKDFIDSVKSVKQAYPDTIIMAGNVCTREGVRLLADAGADIIKVGINPGTLCSTKEITGVGVPQLTAVIECADEARLLSKLICADGGCRVPGDIAKALAAGAHFVMVGGMFMGHNENSENIKEIIDSNSSGGPVITGKLKVSGMSSREVMEKYYGKVEEYRAAEGKTVYIEPRGKLEATVKNLLGGLRSTCTYVGASKLSELYQKADFIHI